MTAAQTFLSPPDPSHDDDRALRTLHIAQLGVLTEMGLRLAGEIERQATDPAEGEERLEAECAGRAFGRAARAVRLAILLQTRLIEARNSAGVAALTAAPDPELETRKADVQRIVGRVIAREVEWNRAGTRNELARQAAERLDRDFSGDILARPISELIDLICKDLGLDPQWPRLAQEAWALDEIAGGDPGAALAAFAPAPPDEGAADDPVRSPLRARKPQTLEGDGDADEPT